MLLLHLSIALINLIVSTYTLFAPSQRKLQAGYTLTALTLASGTLLVFTAHANILRACMSGLLFTAMTLGMSAVSRKRLAKEHIEN